MKKESVNKAFILLDKTLRDSKSISNKINPNKNHGFTHLIDHDPEGLKHKVCDENPLLWQTTEPDHNGYYICFLFKTENKYRKTTAEYRDVVLKNSELRKVLLKNDIAEVGVTIENTLQNPTDICWGYKFLGYQYYIIKNGETTFTKNRSVIRKIYNDKPISVDKILIRVGEYEGEKTYTLDQLTEYGKKLFHCVIGGGEYLIGNEDSILEYGCKIMLEKNNKQWLIEYLGGADKIINHYIKGVEFNIIQHFIYNWEDFADFMKLDKEEWKSNNHNRIQHTNYDIDNKKNRLSGLYLYKLNK